MSEGNALEVRRNMKLLISIIVAVKDIVTFKRENTFLSMLNGILLQDYGRENIEVIAVDGASSDGTIALLDSYKREGLIDRYISEPDDGIYDAMNKGAGLSRGEIVTFLNTDDFLERDAVSNAAVLMENESTNYCYGDAVVLEKSGKTVDIRYADERYIFFHTPYCHQSLFVKRDAFFKAGGYSKKYKIIADWDLMLKLYLEIGGGVARHAIVCRFREGGVSANRACMQAEREILIEEWARKYLNLSYKDIIVLYKKRVDSFRVNAALKKLNSATLTGAKELFLEDMLSILYSRMISNSWYRFSTLGRRERMAFLLDRAIGRRGKENA